MRSEEYRSSETGHEPLIYAGSLSNRGGTGVYTRRLLKGFAHTGAPVSALVGGLVMSPKEALEHEALESSALRTAEEYLKNPVLTGRLRPSVVHLPSFSGRVPEDIPYIVTMHDLAFARQPNWFPFLKSLYYRLHFKNVAKNADAVIVDSGFTAGEAGELLGIPENRIRIVYLSTETFETDPMIFRNHCSLFGDYVVYAGTVEPRKNLEALLDAWEGIRDRLEELKLVVAGRWGWGPGDLLRRLRSTEGVLYTGELSDSLLKSCVCGAELLVYPSLYEGFGLPPLEAASAGVASVVSPAAALKEIYGEVATVSRGFDAESLGEAMLEGLETRLSPFELRNFAEGFSNEKMAGEVMKIYGEFAS